MNARVLVVDDEVAQMRALCNTLEVEGYQATGYSSSTKALESIRPGEHELLLTDLMMPELDGIGLIQAARAIDPELAGVIMTGHGTIDTAVTAMQVGALDYVLKPFKLNVILGVINRALEIRRLKIENALLQRKERDQTLQLAAAYQDLEAFSYSVSHDLRSPLRAIRGFADIYLSDFADSIPSDGRAHLDKVIAGAERMDRLIEGLLRFCRYSRVPLSKKPVGMNNLVLKIAAELQSMESARSIELSVGDLPACEGDPMLLEQVLVNLLSNAFKFTREATSARIEVGTLPGATGEETTSTVYFVRDNGAGFDMTYADRLFGVFQRFHADEQFSGTGVGLSIAHRILQRHGGRIWAESAPGKGATFFFSVQE